MLLQLLLLSLSLPSAYGDVWEPLQGHRKLPTTCEVGSYLDGSTCVGCPTAYSRISGRWKDQGWGNYIGRITAKIDGSEDWIWSLTSGYAPHLWTDFDVEVPVDSSGVQFGYVVGGGGHNIYLQNTVITRPDGSTSSLPDVSDTNIGHDTRNWGSPVDGLYQIFTTSSTGATSVSECNVCDIEYYGSTSCTHCGESSTTAAAGSTSVSQCYCEIGYFSDEQACSLCPNGFVTASTGSTSVSSCTVCSTNLYDDGSKCAIPTADIAITFIRAASGEEFEMSPGTLDTWDGIDAGTQLSLRNKFVSILCNNNSGGTCTWTAANLSGKRVTYVRDNGGTSTLARINISDGNVPTSVRFHVKRSEKQILCTKLTSIIGGRRYIRLQRRSYADRHGFL